jgi:multidrug efflux pump subunit AcrB
MEIDIENTSYEVNDHLLMKLKYYLNFELSGAILYAISFMNEIALLLSTILAIVFTPFMLYVLYKTRKYGWSIFFAVIILIPLVVSLLIFKLSMYLQLFLLIELGLTYLFYFILRFAVNEWCEEINARKLRILHQKEYEEKKALFQKYFDNKV